MSAVIHYHDIGDYLSQEEKLKIIDDFGDIAHIDWQLLTPDQFAFGTVGTSPLPSAETYPPAKGSISPAKSSRISPR